MCANGIDMTGGLVAEIIRLIAERKILSGWPYGKSDLIGILSRTRPDSVDSDFEVIRAWGKAGVSPAGLRLSTSGEKRGFKYHFTLADAGATTVDVGALVAEPAIHEQRPEQQLSQPVVGRRLGEQSPCLLPDALGRITIYQGDNYEVLTSLPDSSVDLIYIDPPFNTGKVQSRTQIVTVRDDEGDRTGFKGQKYRTIKIGTKAYGDVFDDYMAFLVPRLEEAYRLLKPKGSLFLHLDYREVHYAKVVLDGIFGRDSFINEIIWAYDYGARSTKKWSCKHDNILWYAKDPDDYCFNYDEMDRIPYMAPGLVGEEKAARGKTPTDTWWHTIVSPNGYEKTGYPTQKPLGILNRIVKIHSRPGDLVMDFFAGSGTLGESAALHGRNAILVDHNPEAIAVMQRRLERFRPVLTKVGESAMLDSTLSSVEPAEVLDSFEVSSTESVNGNLAGQFEASGAAGPEAAVVGPLDTEIAAGPGTPPPTAGAPAVRTEVSNTPRPRGLFDLWSVRGTKSK